MWPSGAAVCLWTMRCTQVFLAPWAGGSTRPPLRYSRTPVRSSTRCAIFDGFRTWRWMLCSPARRWSCMRVLMPVESRNVTLLRSTLLPVECPAVRVRMVSEEWHSSSLCDPAATYPSGRCGRRPGWWRVADRRETTMRSASCRGRRLPVDSPHGALAAIINEYALIARLPTSAGERRVAYALADRMRAVGCEAEVEAVAATSSYAVPIGLLSAVAVAAGVSAVMNVEVCAHAWGIRAAAHSGQASSEPGGTRTPSGRCRPHRRWPFSGHPSAGSGPSDGYQSWAGLGSVARRHPHRPDFPAHRCPP